MKKQIALFLALLLAASMCAAFSAYAEGNLSAPGSPGPIWLGAEPRKIKIMIPDVPQVSDFKNNDYTKWVEQSCNVDLEFDLLPASDTMSKLTTMVAGNQLRERGVNVLAVNMTNTQAKMFAEEGQLLDLSEYFRKGLAVNIDKAVAKYPDYDIVNSITTVDGKIYGIPQFSISTANECHYKMWVNKGWLDKLGIEIPDTIDEFYNMLVRFKNEDRNGNGKADEIPFVTAGTGWGNTPYKFLTNSYVFEGDGDLFLLKDGKVSVSYIQPEWFEACDFLRKLRDEGLMSDQSLTYSGDDIKALAHSDDIIGVTTNSTGSILGSGDDPVRLRYIPIAPLEGPHGVRQASYTKTASKLCWFITPWTKEQDPELAELCFRVGDFQFTEEGYLRGRFGLENQNWMTVETYQKEHPGEGDIIRPDLNNLREPITKPGLVFIPFVDGAEPKYVYHNDQHGNVNSLYWFDCTPYFSGDCDAEGCFPSPDKFGKPLDWDDSTLYRISVATRVYHDLRPGDDVYVPALIYTDEELSDLGDIQSSLQTYVNEQRTKYILGQPSDLDNKETFINNLHDTFELDKFLEIANTAYQRQMAAKAASAPAADTGTGADASLPDAPEADAA